MSDNLPDIKDEKISIEEEAIESTSAPLLDHLAELRNRIFYSIVAVAIGFAICFGFWRKILEFLLLPYQHAAIALKGKDALKNGLGLIYTAPMETVVAQIDVALFGGIVLAFPIVAFQLYRFVAPGLYSHEKKAFLPFLLMSPILFILGAAMAYYLMMPMLMQFSLNQEIKSAIGGVAVNYQGKVSEYISTITTLILAFGACFQLPIIQLLLGRAGIVDSKTWFSMGRYAIVIIFAIAAVFTPPDIISQFVLAVPLVGLYYSGAWLVSLGEKKNA